MILSAASLRYRSEALDLIRFACAVWVLFAHVLPWADLAAGHPVVPAVLASASSWLVRIFQPAGETHPAVLVFIVLSGYCIHRGGFRGDPTRGLAAYSIRRTWRIVPVYLLAVAAGAAAWSFSSDVSRELTQRLSGTTSIDTSTLLLRLSGLSAFVPPLNPLAYAGNAPLHTVMVEIWLYVAYPALLALMVSHGERRVALGLCVMWVAGALMCSRSPALSNWWHNGSLFGFLPYWWIGAAFVGARFDRRLVLVAGVVWLALTLIAPRHLLLVEVHKASLGVLAGLAIAALDRQRVRVPALGAWFGRAGYSLYAFHAPIAYTLLILGWQWPLVALAAIATGSVVFVCYEAPLNALGRRLAARMTERHAGSALRPVSG